jgi:hypothetical protein
VHLSSVSHGHSGHWPGRTTKQAFQAAQRREEAGAVPVCPEEEYHPEAADKAPQTLDDDFNRKKKKKV